MFLIVKLGRPGWNQVKNILEYQVNEYGLYTVEKQRISVSVVVGKVMPLSFYVRRTF